MEQRTGVSRNPGRRVARLSAILTWVDVDQSYCGQIVDDILTSYPPGHGTPATVVVRCLIDAPCAFDRLKSEGVAEVTMEDGFQWDRGFGPGVVT